MNNLESHNTNKAPWNKGKLVGQKPALKMKEVWGIRIRLQLKKKVRDLALFNIALDSKLRGCDVVKLMVNDVIHGGELLSRSTVMQQKTHHPVRFEITDQTRKSLQAWIQKADLHIGQYLFPSRNHDSEHISTRQYARIVKSWVKMIGLDPRDYGTHSLRRTKASLIYRKTKNLRAVQLLLGHTKLESTVRHLGIDVDDALQIAEQIEI